MSKIFFVLILFASNFAYSVELIDICDRGEIGKIIALATNAKDCASVSEKEMSNLNWLDVRRESSLEVIPKDAFQGLTNLKSLKIRENRISKVEDYAFRGLKSLVVLDFTDNSGPLEFSENSFQGLSSINEIHLSRLHGLQALPKNIFKNLNSLSKLSLAGTLIERIEKNWFKDLSNLEELYLVGNELKLVNEDTFSDLRLLKSLSLSQNSKIKFQGRVFKDMNYLESLNLFNCYIESIPNLNGLRELKTLNLSYNSISKTSPGDFSMLVKLENLDLSGNRIGEVGDHTFKSLYALRWLDLSLNQISFISKYYSGLTDGVEVYGVSVVK